jgi:hypothetical protein
MYVSLVQHATFALNVPVFFSKCNIQYLLLIKKMAQRIKELLQKQIACSMSITLAPREKCLF